MNLPFKLSYRYRIYLHGLFASILTGVSNSAVLMMVDSQDFNLFSGGFDKLASVATTSAVISFFVYIKEHPLPNPMKDTDYYEVRSVKAEAVRAAAVMPSTPPAPAEHNPWPDKGGE